MQVLFFGDKEKSPPNLFFFKKSPSEVAIKSTYMLLCSLYCTGKRPENWQQAFLHVLHLRNTSMPRIFMVNNRHFLRSLNYTITEIFFLKGIWIKTFCNSHFFKIVWEPGDNIFSTEDMWTIFFYKKQQKKIYRPISDHFYIPPSSNKDQTRSFLATQILIWPLGKVRLKRKGWHFILVAFRNLYFTAIPLENGGGK